MKISPRCHRNYAIGILLAALGLAALPVQNLRATGTWVALANQPPEDIDTMLLLSDGTIMAAGTDSNTNWYRLTPSSTGDYSTGTWTQRASMNYSRLYYSSDVMTDGRMLIAGAEYGTGTMTSEIYDPVMDTWTILPPSGQSFVDSVSIILANGGVLSAPVFPSISGYTVIYQPSANSWTAGPQLYRGSYQDEASWVKLPDDSILTIDPFGEDSERYIPSLNRWVNDAVVPVELYDSYGSELGPAFMLPNGQAFFVGSTPKTAFYTPSGTTNAGVWKAGPAIPNNSGAPDAPGAMMVNGKILLALSPTPTSANHFPSPTTFYEFDPTVSNFTAVAGPTGSTFDDSTFILRMLDLPDGNVLLSLSDTQLYIYKPDGTPLAAGKPGISSLVQNLDGSYLLTGTNFNGICQGAAYGDDAQMDSNYPLVRITNSAGAVFYARSYSWSSTSVRTGNKVVSNYFALPPGLGAGTNSLVVVANGNASAPITFVSPALELSLPAVFNAVGPMGGPFTGASQSFTLTNASAAPLAWALSNTPPWLAVSPVSGVIPAGGVSPAITASLTAAANALFPGAYPAILSVSNSYDSAVRIRTFDLNVTAAENFQPFQTAMSALQPLGYWRLNETNTATSGGTATNLGSLGANADGGYTGLFAWTAGAIQGDSDQSASFLGGGYVDVPYITEFTLNPPFTAEAWVKAGASVTSGNFVCAFSCGEFASPRSGWLLYQAATGWDFRMYNQNGTSTSVEILTGPTPVPGVWYHVAAEYDGTNAYLYVNGVGASGAPTGFVPNVDGDLTIGERSDNSFEFNGSVDEFALYASVLPPATVAAHYMRGTNAADPDSYSQMILSNSPIVYFRLDADYPVLPALNIGTAGAPANGAYELGVVSGTPGATIGGLGATNYSCFFNGLASYVDVPGTDMDFSGAVTIMAWIQAQTSNGHYQTVAGAGDPYYRLSVNSNGIPLFADGTATTGTVTGTTSVDDNQWHHLAGVYDGANSEYLYVDGQLVASRSNASVAAPTAPDDFWIGGAPDYGLTRMFNGAVDEVAVFNQALSAAQIGQIYRSAFDAQPIAGNVGFSGNMLDLNWSALAGRSYQSQFTTNLLNPSWMNLGGPLVASNTTLAITDSVTNAQRFYRLMLVP